LRERWQRAAPNSPDGATPNAGVAQQGMPRQECMPAAMPLLKSGLVKVLGVSSAKRSGIAPDVPAVAETAGFKDFAFTLWQGIFAPHGTPADIVAKLNSEINKVLNDPDTRQRLVEAGADVEAMSVDQFRAFVDAESNKYLRIIKETGVTAE